jgi:peptidoglycan/xylan/chitin deacetylase (PgdA/CDA1 family)
VTALSGLPVAYSFDIDNLWSYMKTHGDPGWQAFPSYLDRLIPEVLDFLDRRKLRIAFFIVGQDAVLPKNSAALASLVQAGHDVGNHSFAHDPWLHTKTPEAIAAEIGAAEEAILAASGRRPLGFRGPGFSWSPALLQILSDRRYLYDASSLPTYLGPLGRLYYFAKARLTESEKKERRDLFGGVARGRLPAGPYLWRLPSSARLLEIPVTTMPGLKLPFHLSYLLYLGQYSPGAMRLYLRAALAACRSAGIGASFLLHPLDFLSGEEVPELRFFPGMAIDQNHKKRLVAEVFDILGESSAGISLETYAGALAKKTESLRVRTLPPEGGHS